MVESRIWVGGSRKFILLAVIVLSSLIVSAFAAEIDIRNDSIQMGLATNISSNWQIRVLSVTPDANEVVRNENMFNSPPKEENQYLIARIKARNIGSEANQFNDYHLNVVGASNVSYEPVNEVVPNTIPSTNVFPSGSLQEILLKVKQTDINSLVMYSKCAKPLIFFSLRPSPTIGTSTAGSLKNDIMTIQASLGISPTKKSLSNILMPTSGVPKMSGSDTSGYSNPCDKTVYVNGYY